MSSKQRRAELDKEWSAKYEAMRVAASRIEQERELRFGSMLARLRELGIDPDTLAEYLRETDPR